MRLILKSVNHLSSDTELLFKNKLNLFVDNFLKRNSLPLMVLDDVLTTIGSIFSRANQSMFYFKMDWHTEGSGLIFKMSFSVICYRIKAVERNFVVSGKPRPAYKVGGPVPRKGFLWITIPSGKLVSDSPFAALPLEAFIQSHALIRMQERLNCIYHGEMELILNISLETFETVIKYKQTLLIPAMFHDSKIGYFVVEVVEGVVLIKTFLFITNTGTPEGDKLDRELNAGKLEKEFLKLNRLSTYVNSDLSEEPRIREIFEKIGLGYMCNLDREKYSYTKTMLKGYAADFVKYMNLNRQGW